MCGSRAPRSAIRWPNSAAPIKPTWPRCRALSRASDHRAAKPAPKVALWGGGECMDHMGDWMLPGAALALLVIAGIVLVAFDDVAMGLLSLRWKRAKPAAAGADGEALG